MSFAVASISMLISATAWIMALIAMKSETAITLSGTSASRPWLVSKISLVIFSSAPRMAEDLLVWKYFLISDALDTIWRRCHGVGVWIRQFDDSCLLPGAYQALQYLRF